MVSMINTDDRRIHPSSNDADSATETSTDTISSIILKSSILAALFSLSTTSEAQEVVHKMSSCPSGYRTSGNYCLSNR